MTNDDNNTQNENEAENNDVQSLAEEIRDKAAKLVEVSTYVEKEQRRGEEVITDIQRPDPAKVARAFVEDARGLSAYSDTRGDEYVRDGQVIAPSYDVGVITIAGVDGLCVVVTAKGAHIEVDDEDGAETNDDTDADGGSSEAGLGAELVDSADDGDPLWWADIDGAGDGREYLVRLARKVYAEEEEAEMTARRVAALVGVDYHVETRETRPAPSVTTTAKTAVVELPDEYENIRVAEHGVQL
ncbi:hypothetical protein [Haloarcula rubripromontorii]|uniref:hypothetical protein n=1 Tax=Haloarcula rubripromontorii TaxID=1705562 RepID=UPI00345B8434